MVFKKRAKATFSPDDFSFRELFEANYPTVLRHLRLILCDRAAAEDIAQETFLRLYQRPPREFTNLSGWLLRVASNLAYNHLRGEKNRKKREAAEALPQVTPDEELMRAGVVEEVQAVLGSLDERDRVCLVLKFSGFSYDEIAEITGINKNSVGTVLARALEKFRRAYERKREHVL